MKFQFRVKDEDNLKDLQENQLILLYEFFKEKTLFQVSQTHFLACLNPPVIKPYEHSRVLLFAYNQGETSRTFESSISVGLIQGTYLSRIKHAPPLTFSVLTGQLLCVEFPLKGNNTPRGEYRINIKVKNVRTEIKRIAEDFSINSLCELIPDIAYVKIPASVLTRWALKKLKERRIQVKKADVIHLGSSTAAQMAAFSAGEKIEDGVKREVLRGENMGTVLSGLAGGVLGEMTDFLSPSLMLTVI